MLFGVHVCKCKCMCLVIYFITHHYCFLVWYTNFDCQHMTMGLSLVAFTKCVCTFTNVYAVHFHDIYFMPFFST